MSEERFDEIIEQAADRVDCSLTQTLKNHPSLRITSRSRQDTYSKGSNLFQRPLRSAFLSSAYQKRFIQYFLTNI